MMARDYIFRLLVGSAMLLLSVMKSYGQQSATFTNSIGMEFIRIAPGEVTVGQFQPPYPVPDDTVKGAERPYIMWMGDGRPYNAAEFQRARELALRDARPGFVVRIAKPFYIGKFEVTQRQWREVMGENPSQFQGDLVHDADSHPVENVTWEDARRFIARLNEKEGVGRYRLPTEFEWEYAARAGASGDIPWSLTNEMAQLGGKTTYPVG